MIADERFRQFHRQAASDLITQYHDGSIPKGFHGTLAWHWALAHQWNDAVTAALDEAETHITEQNINGARYWCERALEFLVRLPNNQIHISALRAYSLTWTVLDFAGQHDEALYYAQRLQSLTLDSGTPIMAGGAWLALGRSQRALCDFGNAEASLRRALDLARQHSNLTLEAEAMFHLGKTQQMQGRHLEAIQHYNAAHERGIAIDDRLTIAKIITSLGDVYRILGRGRQAAEHYNRALELEEHLPGLLGVAIVHEKLALSYLELNEVDKALRYQSESIVLREQLNDQVGLARGYTVLGTIHGSQGDHTTAIEVYGRALTIEQSLQNVHGLVTVNARLGDEYRFMGDYGSATTYYRQALDYAQKLNDQLGIALIYERLGALAHEWNDVDAASQHWGAALSIRQQLGHYDEQHRLRDQLRQIGAFL